MTRHFCTLFDSNYLIKGVAMLRSLFEHCPDAIVYLLCMDQKTRNIVERFGFSRVKCLNLSDVETEEILAVKADRTRAEYCWTLSPVLPWYILQSEPSIEMITYLDADLLFYSDLSPIFDEIGAQSIAIIEHRFTPRLQHLEVNGRFCVEWVSFRRDEEGLSCLKRWRDQCIEWCYYRLEDNRMGDQKYLDAWPSTYGNTHIIAHAGAGIAPWNYAQYSFGTDEARNPTVDGAPVIFYHFHQFQLLANGKFDRLSTFYTSEKHEPDLIYKCYEASLATAVREIRQVVPGFSDGMQPAGKITMLRWVQQYVPRGVKDVIRPLLGR